MKNVSQKNLNVFGWGLVLILAFFGARSWIEHGFGWFPAICIALISFFAVLTALRLPLLRTIYDYWMKAAGVISTILTIIILSLLYYFLFTPLSLLLKCGKKDLMERTIDKNAASYWISLEEKTLNKNDYHKQF